MRMWVNIKTQIDEYVKNKTWYWYLPLWFFGWYVFFKLLGYDPNNGLPFVISIAQAFDFMLHEMAHIVTAFLPSILTASAGSLSELLLGIALIVTAFKTRGYFAVMICALWFMLACQSAGVYMADARAQKLELVSLGGALSGSDTAIHDWHFVFGKLHILPLDTFIGGAVRLFGVLVGLAGLMFAAWIMYKMAAAKLDPQTSISNSEKQMMLIAQAETHAQPSVPHIHKTDAAAIYPVASKGTLADKPHAEKQ
jgi:hypothetical protein